MRNLVLFTIFVAACGSEPHWDLFQPIYVEYDTSNDGPDIKDSRDFLNAMKFAITVVVQGTVSETPVPQTLYLTSSDKLPCHVEPSFYGVGAYTLGNSQYDHVTICRSTDNRSLYTQVYRRTMMLHELLHVLARHGNHLSNQKDIMYPVIIGQKQPILMPDDVDYLCSPGVTINGICSSYLQK